MITLPEDFVAQVKALLPDEWELFIRALGNDPVTSVRMNPYKRSEAFSGEQVVEWCVSGRYLQSRPSFIEDPLFHAGAYYVQESSSMFLDHLLKKIRNEMGKSVRVLDLCASPGGKSTVLLDNLKDGDLLVSNEIIRSRMQVLNENLQRWGRANVFISNNDPKDFSALHHYFDIILVDAPCSGEGLFRKSPKAADEWSPGAVSLCAGRQQRILKDIIPALKPGGYLVYSTCTFNEKENEENIEGLIREHGFQTVPVEVDKSWGLVETGVYRNEKMHSWHFYPHKVKGEGLFISCLQKSRDEEDDFAYPAKHEKPLATPVKKVIPALNNWLKDPQRFELIQKGNLVYAVFSEHSRDLRYLSGRLNLVNTGITMGELIREQLQPDHALALSLYLSETVQYIEVTREEALRYLKKDTLTLKPGLPAGWTLLRYHGSGLGWVKVLPNRINNYLPVHLRIIKDIIY